MTLVIEMLGDKVIKSDSPLVSSKIDFADFLGLIVCLFTNIFLGIEIERDEHERITDGEF